MLASRWLFVAAPLPAASSRWCIPSGRLLSLLVLVAVPASHGLPWLPRPATLPRCPCRPLFPMALCHSAAILFAMALPACSVFPMALRCSAPGQQHLPDGSSLQRPCRQSSVPTVPCLQQLRHSASAGNKPYRRPCQQQTSSGGEEYFGLASNLSHLGRIC